MKIDQISLQLYTLRNCMTSQEEIGKTLKRVADIGYRTVESVEFANVDDAAFRELCDANGLRLSSAHVKREHILQEPEKVIAKLDTFDCRYAVLSFPAGVDFQKPDEVQSLIRALEASGKVLRAAGKTLLYHNHQIEFQRLDGQLILEKIFHETSLDHLQAELDVYWVQVGGGNPEKWVRSLRGRLPVIHLKDYQIRPDRSVFFAPVGHGNLNMSAIIEVAESSGVEWFVVEQDLCEGDPLTAVEQSFRWIEENAVR